MSYVKRRDNHLSNEFLVVCNKYFPHTMLTKKKDKKDRKMKFLRQKKKNKKVMHNFPAKVGTLVW